MQKNYSQTIFKNQFVITNILLYYKMYNNIKNVFYHRLFFCKYNGDFFSFNYINIIDINYMKTN